MHDVTTSQETFAGAEEAALAPPFDEGAGEVKVNVKGNGQECPFHTGKVKIKINVKGSGRGRPLYIYWAFM